MRLYLIIIHLFFLSFNLFGQTSKDTNALEYVYTNFTTRDGLPSNETYCVFQDSRGYIWIGTDRGLVKYDGYEFKVYTTEDGLTDNIILSITEDDKGNIWYTGLKNREIGYIDPEMNFHDYEHNDQIIQCMSELGYPYVYFNEIYMKNESIYLVNKLFGYIILDLKGVGDISVKYYNSEESKRIGIGTHIKDEEEITLIYSDVCSYHSQNVLNKVYLNDQLIFKYIRGKCSERYPTLIKDSTLYYIYDGSIMLISNNKEVEKLELKFKCTAYTIPDHGGFIYSTFNEKREEQVVYFSTSSDVRDSKIKLLEDAFVTGVIRSNNGEIWITTDKKGVFYFSDFTSKMSSNNSSIEAIIPYNNGVILQTNIEKQLYVNIMTEEVLSSNYVLKRKDFFNIKSRIDFFTQVPFYDSWMENLGLRKSTIYNIRGIQALSDSLAYIWNKRVCFKIKKDKVSFDYYDYHHEVYNAYNNLDIQTVFCTKEDSCYFGTADGLYKYNKGEIDFLDFSTNQSIRGIEYDTSNKALIYSVWGEGLIVRFESGLVKKMTTKNGLLSHFINQIYKDAQGVIWLATNKGINKCVLSKDDVQIETTINASKLLKSPNVLQMYSLDSILYIGTDNGLNIIDLKSLNQSENKITPLFLDSMNIDGLKGNVSFSELNYDQNNITFHYTGLSFNQYGNINYRYRLKGLSDNWISTKERKAVFTGVIPGHYIFELDVQNEYGDWINLEHPPEFTIRKPYWKTWWFIGGITLIIVLIIGGALYYYISNLKKEKVFLENEQQLSNELNESQQKALSAQLNPHFVFNSLNSIQNFILTKRTELSSDYLSMFSKLMRFVFENSKKLYVPLSDEIEALRLYLELEQVRHNHKFRYEINAENHLKATEIVLPSLLIQPIIENAIWHGLLHKLEDDRLLEINFSGSDTHLCIEVIDNGVGRGQSQSRPKFIKKQRSSGVELTKQRLHLLSQSTGLSTHFEIIDLFDEVNNPNGTCVKIQIPINLMGFAN